MLLSRDQIWAEYLLTQWAASSLNSSLMLGLERVRANSHLVDITLSEDDLLKVDRCVAQMFDTAPRRLITRHYLKNAHITDGQRAIVYAALRERWGDGWPDWTRTQRLSIGITQIADADEAPLRVEMDGDPSIEYSHGGARPGAGRTPNAVKLNFIAMARIVLRLVKIS